VNTMNASMKSDSQGFLVGERVATGAQPDAMSGVSILRSMRTDVGVIRRLLEAGAGQRMRTAKAQAVTARGRGASVPVGAVAATVADRRSAGLRTTGAGVATVQNAARGASNMPARDARGRFLSTHTEPVVVALQRGTVVPKAGAAGAGGQVEPGERDARGRFAGGGQQSSDYAGGDGLLGKISQTLEGIGDAVGNSDQIDPTLAALKEVRDVVSPVGRGVMSLGQRLAERRKERWYDRILKAIKGGKGDGERGGMGGSGADVRKGSFFGTLLGELGGKALGMAGGVLGFLGTLLTRVFAPVAAAWAAWEVGQWLGKKIYDWLTETGLMDKIFEAFDTIKGYFQKASDVVKNTITGVQKGVGDMKTGWDDAKYANMSPEDRREARLDRRGAGPDSPEYKAGLEAGKLANSASDAIGRGKDAVVGAASAAMRWVGDSYADSPLGQMIGAKESKNDYTAYNRTKGGLKSFYKTGLADMSLAEVMGKQKSREIFAAGRFQIIPSTLAEAAKKLKLDPSAKFDKGMQDRIFNDYLITHKRPEIKKFLDGEGSMEKAQLSAAKEWASMPVAPGTKLNSGRVAKGGESYYDGDGLNKSGASLEKVQQVLLSSRAVGATVAAANIPPVQAVTIPQSTPKHMPAAQVANIPERLNSSKQAPINVSVRGEVGQDVGDRTIAHVVTGGLGGSKH
jgi:hypothetical protein